MLRKLFLVAAIGAVLHLSPCRAAQAQSAAFITQEDLQVAVRALSFAYAVPKGDIVIEIVYNPASKDSVNEAEGLQKSIGSGLVLGDRKVLSKMVSVAQMGSTGSKVAYVTHGMQQDYDTILSNSQARGLLTFTTDFACVDQQKCVMGIKASPNIKIEVSRAATAAAGLEFSQALKLMIREVE